MQTNSSQSGNAPLRGRHALVSGAGSGIGEAIAIELAQRGATVTLLGRNVDALKRVTQALNDNGNVSDHGWVQADVANPQALQVAVEAAVAARGNIAILVNNAGVALSAPMTKTTSDQWQTMLDVNLGGTFHCIQAVLPGMQAAKWGRIVNVSSTAGLRGYAYVAAYCAAKHGVIGLTRALALEVARQGITVNAVCPGYTDTPLLDAAVENIVQKTGRSPEQAKTTLASNNPQGRLVTPQEVANAVAWLCLAGSESINGQSIAVAGGEVMQ